MNPGTRRYPNWLPYLLPYLLFLVPVSLARQAGVLEYAYAPVILLVAGSLVFFRRAGSLPELSLKPSMLGIAAGLVGFALWVLPEQLLADLPKLGDPGAEPSERFRIPFAILKTVGMTLVVPIFEELFLRSFLLRTFDAMKEDRDDFREIPLGRYRLLSFLGVVVAAAITHHRWLRAGLYSALLNLVLYREKRMSSVIWAHAVTNLALCVYVYVTGEWTFW